MTTQNKHERHLALVSFSAKSKDNVSSLFITELLVDALFKSGSKLNPEHKSKYMYLLAYAASVCEGHTPGRPVKDELKPTMQAIEKVHAVCCSSASSSELIAELPTLYHCIR